MDKGTFDGLKNRVHHLLEGTELTEGQGAALIKMVHQRTRFKMGLLLRCPYCMGPEEQHEKNCPYIGHEVVTVLGEPDLGNTVVKKRGRRKW